MHTSNNYLKDDIVKALGLSLIPSHGYLQSISQKVGVSCGTLKERKNTKEKIINQKVIAKCKLLVKFTG